MPGGTTFPGSDYDLGLYYRPPIDLSALRRLAREVAGPAAEITEPGAWGPWVDGGGWLDVDGVRVDWIYRDLDRVQQASFDAQAGRFSFHRQPGHQLGVPDFAYVGEVALGVVLVDLGGEVTALQPAAGSYAEALTATLVEGLWEPALEPEGAGKATTRGDTVYIASVVSHALLLCAHALHGRAGRWLINEKGAITSAARLPLASARSRRPVPRRPGHHQHMQRPRQRRRSARHRPSSTTYARRARSARPDRRRPGQATRATTSTGGSETSDAIAVTAVRVFSAPGGTARAGT